VQFNVRRAQEAVAQYICEINIASIQELCAGEYLPEQLTARCSGKTAERCRQRMSDPGRVTLVAEIPDPVGLHLAGFASSQDDWIVGLYVHPDYGKQGVGAALLEALEEELRARGVVVAQLFSTMTAATFYSAHGWTPEAPTTKLVEGIAIACIPMSKKLQ
jgi:putative acetyltransferase